MLPLFSMLPNPFYCPRQQRFAPLHQDWIFILKRLLRSLIVLMGIGCLVTLTIAIEPRLALAQPPTPPADTAPGAADTVALPNPTLPTGMDSNDISAEKVNQFIQAYLQVVALIEQRQADLQGADSELDSLRVQQEIETQAQSLIRAAGLTPPEYLQLLNLTHLDPEFGERVVVQLQEQTAP